jgi:hypothetical protein
MSCVLVLQMAIGVVWGASTLSFYIQGGRGYKEGNRVGYLCLGEHILVFWNLLDAELSHKGPSLGFPSPYEVIAPVLILISRPRVHGK